MRQTFSCFSKLGGTANFNAVPVFPPQLSKYFNGLTNVCKFDNFSRFFMITWLKIVDFPKDGKDASQWDLNLRSQFFSSKTNSLAVIFENTKKCQK